MSTSTFATRIALVAVSCTVLAMPAAAQDQLAAAKDLYATAAYEEALSALTKANQAAAADVEQIDQYRAFCLFALGRTAEAESVVEALVRKDPLFRLDARDASPRIEAMFGQVRKRLLPALIRERFRSIRASLDQQQMAGSSERLIQVRQMLDSAKALNAWDDALDDVSFLVDGFLDLTKAQARKPDVEPPPARAAAPTQPAPVQPPPPSLPPAAQPATSVRQAAPAENVAPPSGAGSSPRVYSSLDADVKSPIAIRQIVPTVPTSLFTRMKFDNKTGGILEILINEEGSVAEVKMRDPANPVFDAMMVEAARTWKYRPATKGGRPVPYIKRVAVSITPTEAR